MLHIKTDPIENTEEYKQAMKHIEPNLEKEFEGKFMVSRPYWARKKAMLAARGIIWRAPNELNPSAIFD